VHRQSCRQALPGPHCLDADLVESGGRALHTAGICHTISSRLIILRRACAKLRRGAGGELEQIQLLLGHASVQTTERYLGTKQDLVHAPNDGIKLRLAV
jgi:integrase